MGALKSFSQIVSNLLRSLAENTKNKSFLTF